MHITIYSTTTCTYCHTLRAWLEQHGFAYDYKQTDEDPAAMQEFLDVSDGALGVPFTVITDEQGNIFKVLGFDRPKLQSALGI
jgi:glutaredoxin 3